MLVATGHLVDLDRGRLVALDTGTRSCDTESQRARSPRQDVTTVDNHAKASWKDVVEATVVNESTEKEDHAWFS